MILILWTTWVNQGGNPMSTQVGVSSIYPQLSHLGNFLFQWMEGPDGCWIVVNGARSNGHRQHIHPTNPTTQHYTSTFWPLGTEGNVPLGTTIDLSFTERGHVANFYNSVPLVTRPFFPLFLSLALSSARWQLASGLAGLIIIGLWMSARGGH
jgi:hypothetical protein